MITENGEAFSQKTPAHKEPGIPIDLSIIIVNWNSKDYLQECIDSILKSTSSGSFEIIVIDCASFDGCEQLLRQCYPQVRFIQNDTNMGFARANNEAFRVSGGLNVLFLNPDTKIRGAAIETLLRGLESNTHAGIVGAKLLNGDGTIQKSSIRSFPTILNQMLDADLLMRLFPRSRLWGTGPLFDQSGPLTEVDAISGACMMIKRHVFQAVGMFSTDYFMYSEDIDLCHKVRKLGLKTYYIPGAVVVHYGGGSSSKNSSASSFPSVMMMESRWRFFRKTRSQFYACSYRLAIFSASVMRISILLLVLPVVSFSEKSLKIQEALRKWVSILRWTLGLESWAKHH